MVKNLSQVILQISNFLNIEPLENAIENIPSRSSIAKVAGSWVNQNSNKTIELSQSTIVYFESINSEMMQFLGYNHNYKKSNITIF